MQMAVRRLSVIVVTTVLLVYSLLADPLSVLTSVKVLPSNLSNGVPPSGFIYLVQAENSAAAFYWTNLTRALGRHCIVLCWKERCDDHRSPVTHVLFGPNISLTVGRNRLFEAAVALPTKFLYYSVMDEDAKLYCADHYNVADPAGCLVLYEQLLLTYRPPVGHPSFTTNGLGYVSSPCPAERSLHFDGLFNSIHIDAMPVLLPLDTVYDASSWWVSHAMFILRCLCFKGYVLRFNWIVAANPLHRDYPKGESLEWSRRYMIQTSYVFPLEIKWELVNMKIAEYDMFPNTPPQLPYPGEFAHY
jgi:hypothetical protein